MRKFERYFVATVAITMILMANTVNATFTLIPSQKTQSLSEPLNNGVKSQLSQSNANIPSSSKEVQNGKSESNFLDLWKPGVDTSENSFDGASAISDYITKDNDSMELVIGVNSALPNAYNNIISKVSDVRGKIVNTVSGRGEIFAIVADVPLSAGYSLINDIQASNLAQYIEPNRKFQAQLVPNDQYWSLQWGPQKIQADLAWNTTIGDSSVLVAVIDTGIDYTHPDLAANYVPLGHNWVSGTDDPLDDNGHGTHCAGIIAAVLNNAIGIAGLSQVRIMAEKGLDASGSGYEADLANAIIDAVDKGAEILSNSWGGSSDSMLIHEAVQYAYNNGVLVLAAAGNSASETKFYPAAYDEVVAVTATDSSDYPASFTNYGDWVEVAAPGVNIYSTLPTYPCYLTENSGKSTYYDYLSGTSMACPHVAGVAALIWSRFPNASRDWVRARLRYTANDLGSPGFDIYYGYGRINAYNATVQTLPNHDLLIANFERPKYIQPGDIASLNATVLNFGANAENNVTVELLVNGNLTDSKTISHLANLTSTTVGLSWNPLIEGTYNVTLYIVPVSGETNIENNLVSEMIPVKSIIGFVLFDQTRCEPIDWYSEWVANLNIRGYAVDTYSAGFITPDVLAGYDIFVIPAAISNYLADEISAIQNFVIDGGGLLVIGDYQPTFYTNLTSFAGITWAFYYGWSGTTYNIIPHDVTEGVGAVYFDFPLSELFVNSPAEGLILDGSTDSHVMLAVSEVGAGRVISISDQETVDNLNIGNADNLRLANNMIDWLLGVKYEHELIVSLDAPSYLVPGESTQLNATVYNRGLHNETNVEFELLIDGIIESNVTIPLLENGTEYSISYAWTPPSVVAVYNVTAYAPPVLDENITLNNAKTKFVSVHYPLINPEPGQYSNYILNIYYPSGELMGTGYLNFTYEYYIEPHKIYVAVWEMAPDGTISTGWLIVNTMNRLVEAGFWAGLWYPGWIETNIDIGSTINLVYGVATVNGTRTMVISPRVIDCWEISELMSGTPYTFWYDKASGLWIRMEVTIPFYEREELILADTNIPIGIQHEHDLGVTIEAPQKLQPGDSSMLNATVYNLGLNNESNVTIQILINGTSVASASSLYLANGTWYTLDYNWTAPTVEGIYNVTAYASPVIDENVTINNIASKIVNVRSIKVALISANTELTTIASILDSMGIGYDVYNNNNMYLYTENLSLLLKYKAVIFYNAYRSITSNEYSALESYLSAGGTLLVTGYDCLVSDTLLANIVRSSSTGDDVGQYDLIVVDNTHPIMNGPYGSFSAGYDIYGLYGDCDRAKADTVRGAVTVAELADGYDRIIATEGLSGKVVFWNGEGTYDWAFNSDCQIMLKNLMHWFLVRYEHELTVHLQTPLFLEPGDSATLNATVTNNGLSDETDVNLQLLINGTLVANVTVPVLFNGSSYTINYLWIPNRTGKYNVTVYAPPVFNETITANNIYSKLVPVQYAPRILAYVEYTDYYQDYRNTLNAINSTFGPNYILTELHNYAQLDSMLQGKDILLIPDQEYASLNTMEMIGETWTGTLNEFLEHGGTIILCDGDYGYGVTYGILIGANLMQISYTNYRSYYQLYLVDPSDPLAKGVSASFEAPYVTVSYGTGETNVVVNDGTYPVVIHKKLGQGDIALLGFDFEYSNEDTERILGNAVELGIHITISVNVNSGSPGAEAKVSGIKATPNGTISIYWDDTLAGNTTASGLGNFVYLLTVPEDASIGVHEIKAVDITTNRTASMLFKVIQIILNPAEGPVGTKVTVYGSGFTPSTQATVTFNDMLMGYANVDSFGNFTFTLNIPLSAAGVQTIKTFETASNYAFAMLAVVDVTPLDVTVDVGALHFIGEVAEFYAQVSLRGIAVNATSINAVLYKPDGATESQSPQLIATGLYKIPYTILGNETGTYTLVVTAGYTSDTSESNGTSFKCFLVSATLALMNDRVIEIKDGLALVQNDLGFIKLNLTAMNVTLQSIFLKVISINGTTATIQTMIGVMNGTITEIDNNTATIVTPIGNIEADVSSLLGTQQALIIPQYAIIIIALIAAVSSTLTLFFIRRRKTVEAK
jgi:thermitase